MLSPSSFIAQHSTPLTAAVLPTETHKTEQTHPEEFANCLYSKTEYYIRQSRELRAELAKSIQTLRHSTSAFNNDNRARNQE